MSASRQGRGGWVRKRAFTLLEMLVVIAIIGILAGIALPSMKGIGQSNLMAAANREVLDTVSLARFRALNERTTVYILFVGPVAPSEGLYSFLSGSEKEQLLTRQFNSMRLFAARSVGDQPGQHRPRYLSDWKELPEGVLFAPQKFAGDYSFTPAQGELKEVLGFEYRDFPYPKSDSPTTLSFAYIAFDPPGGVSSLLSQDSKAVIPLSRASYFLDRTATGLTWGPASPRESPPFNSVSNYNHVVIDGLTGRGTTEQPEVQ